METSTARAKLAIRKKPYWQRLGPGMSLGYRRNEGPGTWSVRAAGGGKEWLRRIGLADDFEVANGEAVLNFEQAVERARKLVNAGIRSANRESASGASPVTIDNALLAYETDLLTRGALVYNAKRPRKHLPRSLVDKPLALISEGDLMKWRNELVIIGKMTISSVNRTMNVLQAALELAMPSRSHVWRAGLKSLPDASRARNLVLKDEIILSIVARANEHKDQLGVLCQVLAETGCRPVQAARLLIDDLVADKARPRLMMPRTAKGGGRNRAAKKRLRIPVAISPGLAKRLQVMAGARHDAESLLLRADGKPWSEANVSNDYRHDFKAIIESISLPPTVTAYCFRHSSIARRLLKGMPTKLCADMHDTSVKMIEQHYGKYIIEHGDDIARATLLTAAAIALLAKRAA